VVCVVVFDGVGGGGGGGGGGGAVAAARKTKCFFFVLEKSNFDAELARWRMKHAMEPVSGQEGTMHDCSLQEFPAIHKVLSIFLTTPVGSLSCEHHFSAQRSLKL